MRFQFIAAAIVLSLAGCTSKQTALDQCVYEAQKSLMPLLSPNAAEFLDRERVLVIACMKPRGWEYSIERAEARFQAGKSKGLRAQLREPDNWIAI